MASLTLTNVAKSFGRTDVIHDISLDIANGELVVFVGPSGCGKSTLLRMIAGLEEISAGEIAIGERTVNQVAPSKRGVAMVFQSYALYPHMTVYRNMSFGLKQAKMHVDEIDRRVREAAKILHIEDYLERTPRALSGGQRQRVAIGRAIVREPDVFLFDEPLSNLDAALRGQTRLEIARLHDRLKTTMIYVTHDQVEAMTLADRIVVLRDGRVEQYGTPMDLYDNPGNMFVAGFIGSPSMNFFSASKTEGGIIISNGEANPLTLTCETGNPFIGIRPEHLSICSKEQALIAGRLELIEHLGDHVLAYFPDDNGAFVVKLNHPGTHKYGDIIHFHADLDNLHYFDGLTGNRLK